MAPPPLVSQSFRSPRRERASFRQLGHLKNLGTYFRRYAWVLCGAIAGLLLTRIFDAIVPLLMKTAVDSLADAAIEPNVMLPALGIMGIVAMRFSIYVIARRIMRRVSISVSYDLRKRMFNHIQYQGPNFFNRFNTGDLMSRSINDINMVRMVVSFGWVEIILFAFSICTGLYFMARLSPTLTSIVVIPLPIVAIVGFLMARGMFPYYRNQQEAMADVTAFTQENLNGIRTIQASSQEEQEIKRFYKVSTHFADMVFRATRYQATLALLMSTLSASGLVLLVVYGGALALRGEITIGTYTAFSSYMWMVMMPVRWIGMSLSMFAAAAASTQRIFEVLDYEHEIKDAPEENLPAKLTGHVQIRDLTYTHPGAARPAIEDINIEVPAGETVALLGRVGSGKSTILKALVRLVDTPRGTVFIDGQDVCDFPIQSLRRLAALVPQDPFLFSTTLRENLTYDDPERDDEPLWEAAEAAGFDVEIRDFPDGLETIVGERGQTLSGGQKQRAALARGMVRGSPILLLDDCFSSVDTETEERILSGLTRMREGRTTLLISHRVSTARHADRIFIIDSGRISESGTHDELMRLGGYYADLAAIQSDQDKDRERKASLLQDLTREATDEELTSAREGGRG